MSQDPNPTNNGSATDNSQIDTTGFNFSFSSQFPSDSNSTDNQSAGFNFPEQSGGGDGSFSFTFSNFQFPNSENSTGEQQNTNGASNNTFQSQGSSFSPFGGFNDENKSNDNNNNNQNNDQTFNGTFPNAFADSTKSDASKPTIEEQKTENAKAEINTNVDPNKDQPKEVAKPLETPKDNIFEKKEETKNSLFSEPANKNESPQKVPAKSATIDTFSFFSDITLPKNNDKPVSASGLASAPHDLFDFDSFLSPSSSEQSNSAKKAVDDAFADFGSKEVEKTKETEKVGELKEEPKGKEQNINDFGFPSNFAVPPKEENKQSFGGFADSALQPENKEKEVKTGDNLFGSFPASFAQPPKKDETGGAFGGFSDEPTSSIKEKPKEANDPFGTFPASFSVPPKKEENFSFGGFSDSVKDSPKSEVPKEEPKEKELKKEELKKEELKKEELKKEELKKEEPKKEASDPFGTFPASFSVPPKSEENISFGGFSDAVKEAPKSGVSKEEPKKEINDPFGTFPASFSVPPKNEENISFGGFSDANPFGSPPVKAEKPPVVDPFAPKKVEEDNGGKEEQKSEERKNSFDAFGSFPPSFASAPPAKTEASVPFGGFSDTPVAGGKATMTDHENENSPNTTSDATTKTTTATTGFGEFSNPFEVASTPANDGSGFNDSSFSDKSAKKEEPVSTEVKEEVKDGQTKEKVIEEEAPQDMGGFNFTPAEGGAAGFTFNFPASTGDGAENGGFSFPASSSDAANGSGGFTFSFPVSSSGETAENGGGASFGGFQPFGGFTFTPAPEPQVDVNVNEGKEKEATEGKTSTNTKSSINKEKGSELDLDDNNTERRTRLSRNQDDKTGKPPAGRMQRKIRTPQEDSGPFALAATAAPPEENDTRERKSVPIGEISFSAFHDLILDPIFKQNPVDLKLYFDRPDESDSAEAAMTFLRAHAAK